MWIPNYRNVLDIHEELVRVFENEEDPVSPPGIKNENLLHSACSRPLTSIGDHEKYKSVYDKSAALFHSLTKNHAFHNGNKRTALVSLLTMLDRNDIRINYEVTDDQIYDFVVSVTADTFPDPDAVNSADRVVDAISDWVRFNSFKVNSAVSGMKVDDFLNKCRMAGAFVRSAKGGSHLISFKGNSIRISQSTRQIDGPVIRTYLRRLGLGENVSGFDATEFAEGVSRERDQIYRFISALKRLAKT